MAADLDRLEELLDQQEAEIRQAFLDFVATVQSEAIIASLVELIEEGSIEDAMRVIDTYVIRMGGALVRASQAVGQFTAAELGALLTEAEPGFAGAIDFDPTNPRAAEIIRAHRLEFVRGFSEQQRRATRQALDRAFLSGQGAGAVGSALKDSIGLTGTMEAAVANFRNSLETGSRRALEYDARNRRHDRAINSAIARGRPLPAARIDKMVNDYRQNRLRLRAETIARTEGTQAASEAREEALDQMIEQSGIEAARIEEMWNATRDKRTRSHHGSMNGQKRPKGVPFRDGLGYSLRYPGDPKAPAVTRINCRCAKTFSIAPRA